MESLDKQIVIGLALSLVIAFFIPIYWLNEPARQAAAAAEQRQAAIYHGAEVFVGNCASCHGLGGQGGMAPALRNSKLDAKAMERIIGRGVPGTTMPAWGNEDGGPLKRRQIEELMTFVKNWDDGAVAKAAEHVALAAPAPAPGSGTLEGDPARGSTLYRTQGCGVCHGAQGEGGVGPKLKGKSWTFTQFLNRLRSGLGAMPAFDESRLTDSDTKDIWAFLTELK